MKKIRKLHVAGVLAATSLALTSISSYAYVGPTNFFAYNFDSSAQASGWQNWFGSDYVTNAWDPTMDASNNPNSGSLGVMVNYTGSQYVLMSQGYTPSWSGLPIAGLVQFTNVQWDIKYQNGTWPQIRTNQTPWDFGDARIGSRSSSYGQEWFYYYQVPATNSLGQPNTNWVHINADISSLPTQYPTLATSGIVNLMFGQDDGAYGNEVLSGTQIFWLDNIQFNGWIAPTPPPTLSIQKVSAPGLYLFPGVGIYGRSELQISTNYLTDGWIGTGTSYPVSYSFTLAGNATTPQGGLDTHLTFIPGLPNNDADSEGNSGADYQRNNCMWLQFISGSGTNVSCVANFSWKTNNPGCNPNDPKSNGFGGVVLWFTNSVRAGTWTLTWNSPTTGTISCPGTNSLGVNPIPFDLGSTPVYTNGAVAAGNKVAPALTLAGANSYFPNPMYVRFGDMNYGNGSRTTPDIWNSISVSGTAGTNFSVNFTTQGTAVIDTNLWDLTSSDGGAEVTLQVPTNAQYWVNWNTPDTGWNNLVTATNLNGPWYPVEHYNGYADGTNYIYVLPTQHTEGATKWNLMLPQYLPTADGSTNGTGPLSPIALFRLTTDTNRPAM